MINRLLTLKYFIVAAVVFGSLSANAQDFSFGPLRQDFDFNTKQLDSNANAVVLSEFGKAAIMVNDARNRLELVYTYHIRIKILNKEGFKHANIVIPTYQDGTDDGEEILREIEASTFNGDNGTIQETAMDRKAIFKENRDKYTKLTKFTLPNIKEGSIIEFKYVVESPHIFNFHTWEFQSDIPKVKSSYLVYIPGNYNYNVTLRGYQKLTELKSEVNRGCLRLSGVDIDCSKMNYIMENIPAFVEEDYMTASSNFKSAIYFELSDYQTMTGEKRSFTKTWKDVDFELVGEKSIGSQMKRKDLFKDIIPELTKNTSDDLQKAKNIYNYIRKQIKWNTYYGKYSENTIKTALEKRTGNAADVNLSLIAALSAANLDAEAVILSTRENGAVNKLYPIISNFNYLVAKVNIGDKSYLLDATEPLLPFGLLPLRCINDQGRVINLKKPSYWIDMKASMKSTTTYTLTGTLDASGKIKGTITTLSIGYSAFNKRKDIKKNNSAEEYVEKLDEQMANLSILKHEIANIDSVENPLIETYEVEFSVHDAVTKGQLYVNPFFINRISKNPFNLSQRNYPVDLGSMTDERIAVNISLPEKLTLIQQPKDLMIALPANGGRYLLQTKVEDNKLTLNQLMQFNKAIYEPEEYLSLKEFYSKIIQNQKADIVLKTN